MASPPQELIDATMAALEPFKADFPNEPKHYKRPPIKFLSLIVGAINKNTGFGKGVFSESELTGGLSTKEDKLNFFQKLKDYTQLLVGHEIDVEPKSIAAGKDVEKTLVFMQTFAEGAQHPKISFAKAAAKITGQPEPAEDSGDKDKKEQEE